MIHICHAADSGTIAAVLHKYNAAVRKGLEMSLPIAERLGLPDPFEDRAWFTLFVLVVRLRGAQGRNRPYLYRQHLDSFADVLQQVDGGEVLFHPDDMESELLCPEEAEAV